MATAPLLLLIVAAAPRPGDAAVFARADLCPSAAAAVAADVAVAPPRVVSPAKLVHAAVDRAAVKPAPAAKKAAPAPVLPGAVPLRVQAAPPPAVAPRFEPAQPQAPPQR